MTADTEAPNAVEMGSVGGYMRPNVHGVDGWSGYRGARRGGGVQSERAGADGVDRWRPVAVRARSVGVIERCGRE